MEDVKNYYVTEIGCFGTMEEFKDDDPTMEEVDTLKKKKLDYDKLIDTTLEINKELIS